MSKGTNNGRSGRRPRRSASAVIIYTKDSITNYYTASDIQPVGAVPDLLPERIYFDLPRSPKIARNCDYIITDRAGGKVITGLRRRGTGPYRGNVRVYGPNQRKPVYRDLTAKIDGNELTLTLY